MTVREYLSPLGDTWEEIAEKVGVQDTTLCAYHTSSKRPGNKTIWKIAAAMGKQGKEVKAFFDSIKQPEPEKIKPGWWAEAYKAKAVPSKGLREKKVPGLDF